MAKKNLKVKFYQAGYHKRYHSKLLHSEWRYNFKWSQLHLLLFLLFTLSPWWITTWTGLGISFWYGHLNYPYLMNETPERVDGREKECL